VAGDRDAARLRQIEERVSRVIPGPLPIDPGLLDATQADLIVNAAPDIRFLLDLVAFQAAHRAGVVPGNGKAR
jgi:hypothetical protein